MFILLLSLNDIENEGVTVIQGSKPSRAQAHLAAIPTSPAPGAHLDEHVAVQNHEVGGHLRGNFDLLGLQFCIHTEEKVMCIPIVAWKKVVKITLLQRMNSEDFLWALILQMT